ncbi:MAG: hypothetical protein WC451_03220 [Patescibacteria group bacterium]|jgi:hypothetical protein
MFEYKYEGGQVIRLCQKPFEAIHREVLTLEFEFYNAGKKQKVFAHLFDTNKSVDVGQRLYDALKETYGGPIERFVPKEEIPCICCGKSFLPKNYNHKRCDACKDAGIEIPKNTGQKIENKVKPETETQSEGE